MDSSKHSSLAQPALAAVADQLMYVLLTVLCCSCKSRFSHVDTIRLLTSFAQGMQLIVARLAYQQVVLSDPQQGPPCIGFCTIVQALALTFSIDLSSFRL